MAPPPQKTCRVDIACPSCSRGKPYRVLMEYFFDTRYFYCPACKKQYTEDQVRQFVGSLQHCGFCGTPTINTTQICDSCVMIQYKIAYQANQTWHNAMRKSTVYGSAYYKAFYTDPAALTDEQLGMRQWAQCDTCGELYNITGQSIGNVTGITCQCRGLFQVFKVTKEESMTPVTNVRVWWDTSVKAYQMSSPYNADFVEALKKQIPWSDRSYNRETKVWTFVEKQFEPLMAFMSVMGVKPNVTTRAQAEASMTKDSASTSRRPLELVALDFLRTVPFTAMQKAYRQASLDLHPDRNNGASDKFASLTALWDRIKKDVYNV